MVSDVFWVKELEKKKKNIVTFMRDHVRHVHLTFNLNFPISGPNKDRAIDFFLFLRFFGLKISLEE